MLGNLETAGVWPTLRLTNPTPRLSRVAGSAQQFRNLVLLDLPEYWPSATNKTTLLCAGFTLANRMKEDLAYRHAG